MTQPAPESDASLLARLRALPETARTLVVERASRIVPPLARCHDSAVTSLSAAEVRALEWALEVERGEAAGSRIGPYTLQEHIGEGGFGTVWRARQDEPVRREVALKILKAGMETEEVVARFEAERQALAMMAHRGIATVHDAGVTDHGRPYFVMELVGGVPINRFCDHQCLGIEERLHLFIEVCHAVQHAHQKGIIHRDLKPSNILVSNPDGVPCPKIIDFGIAKVLKEPLTEEPYRTRLATFLGTPVYSSPEQIEGRPGDVDARSDLYSLGVILYELLCGRPPFEQSDLNGSDPDRMRRLIRETEPPRPSHQIAQLPRTIQAQLASVRKTEGSTLLQSIRGDLDWIVMRCLEKNRVRRYPTATALASDLERFLANEPVSARPPSRWYVARKFVRRNRGPVAAAAILLAALLLGALASTWQAVRATRAEQRTARALETAISARQRAEGLVLEAHAQKFIISAGEIASNSHGLAHAIASLERLDTPDRRRVALTALWKAPVCFRFGSDDGPRAFFGSAFSPDGTTLATASGTADVYLWTSDNPRPRVLPGDPGTVAITLRYSPSGTALLVNYLLEGGEISSGPYTQALWDTVTLAKRAEWKIGEWGPFRFSADESRLLAYSLSRERPYAGIGWWSIEEERVRPLGSPHEAPPESLGFPNGAFINFCYPPSGDLRWLASWQDRDVYISPIDDTGVGEPLWIGRQDRKIQSVSISFDGALVSSADDEKSILWSARHPGRELARLPAFQGGGLIDLEHARILNRAPDRIGLDHIFDLRGPPGAAPLCLLPFENHGFPSISPDGHWIAKPQLREAGLENTVYNLRAIRPFHVNPGLDDGFAYSTVRLSEGMRQMAVGLRSGTVILIDLTSAAFPGRTVFREATGRIVRSLAFGPQDRFLLVGTDGAGAWLVPLQGGEPMRLADAPARTSAADASPSGQLLAVGGGDLNRGMEAVGPSVLDREGRRLARLGTGTVEDLEQLAFMNDAELVVSSGNGLRVWNFRTNAVRLLRQDPHGFVATSERYLLANGGDAFWLYDRRTWQAKKLAMPCYNRLMPVAIAPDQQFVATREPMGGILIQYVDEDRYHLLPMQGDAVPGDIRIDQRGYWLASIGMKGLLSYWPVPRGEPLHDRPLGEFLAILKAQTNIRVELELVADRSSFFDIYPAGQKGYRYVHDPFPGWLAPPTWQEWYAEDYMENVPWAPLVRTEMMAPPDARSP